MLDRIDDTIVAISSPPGVGARGILRLSGPSALTIGDALFTSPQGQRIATTAGHRRLHGKVRIENEAWIPAEGYVFREPASYTRQDILEIHTVGGPPILAMLLDQCMQAGARLAEPGEFTARAYLNGGMDLTRAEGVAAMIHADNDSQLRASEALLHGQLSRQTEPLRQRLIDLLARLEAEIDFAEEPIEFVSDDAIHTTLTTARTTLNALLRDAPPAERLDVLPRVMLVGKPNVGKSTLFNRLTGTDRVIRSATAGTTRDVIRAPLSLPSGEVMLMDSAGLDDEPHNAAGNHDEPHELAQKSTHHHAAHAHLILEMVDAREPDDTPHHAWHEENSQARVVRVANKTDLLPRGSQDRQPPHRAHATPCVYVSAETGEGIAALVEIIDSALFSGLETHGDHILALSNRQRQALRCAFDALDRADTMIISHHSRHHHAELIALEIRDAINALSLLVGEVATEELLDRIFAGFCIGK